MSNQVLIGMQYKNKSITIQFLRSGANIMIVTIISHLVSRAKISSLYSFLIFLRSLRHTLYFLTFNLSLFSSNREFGDSLASFYSFFVCTLLVLTQIFAHHLSIVFCILLEFCTFFYSFIYLK